MRMLILHADFLEYELTKPIKSLAEEVEEGFKGDRLEDCLAVFASVEKVDESAEDVAKEAAKVVCDMATKVKANRVMIYPYAHLSSNLSSPETAVSVLKALENKLKDSGVFIEVKRAPFGWYKSFSVRCKGHPLSELSRTIDLSSSTSGAGAEDGGEGVTPSVVGEETGEFGKKAVGRTRDEITAQIESEYIILTPDGKEYELDLRDIDSCEILESYPALKRFILSEEVKGQPKKEPPSIKAMQKLELVDYEPGSDAGHFRLYPKGYFIFRQLEAVSRKIAVDELGAVEIATPIMYDWSLPDVRGQGMSFHERQYIIPMKDEGREFVLRFAADFGLFRMMASGTISYRNLPIRVFEFSKSFRREQKGELSGLKRLRAFHMPDLHSFAKDLEQGWEEYKAIYTAFARATEKLGIEYAISFRVVREFYDKYKDNLRELLAYSGQPGFIEVLSQRKHYWVVKNEFQGIDSMGGNLQLGTVQLDVEDASRYGITYTDENGKEKGCIICHSSIGSIERWIYILLEEALKKTKPVLPFFLSPTQVRLIPTKSEYVVECERIADYLGGRVDIDDRDESVGKRIRDAEREWVPLIVVYGDKERESGVLPVRMRSGERVDMGLKDLKREISVGNSGWPDNPLPLPRLLSKRMKFRG